MELDSLGLDKGFCWDFCEKKSSPRQNRRVDGVTACEYRDVAMRPLQREASALSIAETERLIFRLEQFSEAIDVIERHRPLSIDPADDMVLDVAINGRVDVIVTHNVKHLHEPGARFGISVLTPGAFLKRLTEGNR